jgi:DNA-binding XRE family transcriptional regulator
MGVDGCNRNCYCLGMMDRDQGLKVQGEKLAAWRVSQIGKDGKRLSQAAAAKRVNASQGAWAAWERGKKAPDPNLANAIERLTKGKIPARAWVFPRKSSLVARQAEIARAS